MLTALYLLAQLLPAPTVTSAPVGQPALEIAAPSWAVDPTSMPDEPTMPMLAEWVDFLDGERIEAAMASVTPFDQADDSDPFAP